MLRKYFQTLEYQQPNFYKFNEDSIWLVESVLQVVQDEQLRPVTLLDLCSGCGVVGLELAARLYPRKIDITFYEKQAEFLPYLKINSAEFMRKYGNYQHSIINKDLVCFNLKAQYDLILSNPPFFNQSIYRAGKDENRNICKFYDENFSLAFPEVLKRNLNDNGVAFYLSYGDGPLGTSLGSGCKMIKSKGQVFLMRYEKVNGR